MKPINIAFSIIILLLSVVFSTFVNGQETHKFNTMSNYCYPENANVLVEKNVNVSFKFEDIKEDYISNYPIKGFKDGQIVIQGDYPFDL